MDILETALRKTLPHNGKDGLYAFSFADDVKVRYVALIGREGKSDLLEFVQLGYTLDKEAEKSKALFVYTRTVSKEDALRIALQDNLLFLVPVNASRRTLPWE